MKFVSENGRIFDKMEDCLRYEGACHQERKQKDGCLTFLLLLAMVGVFCYFYCCG